VRGVTEQEHPADPPSVGEYRVEPVVDRAFDLFRCDVTVGREQSSDQVEAGRGTGLLSVFPIDLFMLIFGVTYFFGIASVNGTLDWLVHRLVAQVRGRSTFVPPLMFLLVSAAASAGALAPSVVAVFAPLALRLARQLNISRLLVAIMVVQGANAGALTPIGGLGPLVNGVVERNGLVLEPITLFALNYAFNAILAVAAYVLLESVPRLRTRLRQS
jgi:Na+/H+ antiporter NhaD/arsenite permease-like protein